MRSRESIIAAIRPCKTRAELDDILKCFEITDTQEKYKYLIESMYNPETFSTPGQVSPEQKLEFTIAIFLTGGWRLNEYYERMGIGLSTTNA